MIFPLFTSTPQSSVKTPIKEHYTSFLLDKVDGTSGRRFLVIIITWIYRWRYVVKMLGFLSTCLSSVVTSFSTVDIPTGKNYGTLLAEPFPSLLWEPFYSWFYPEEGTSSNQILWTHFPIYEWRVVFFQQIPIGTICALLIANCFPYSHESEFL